MQHFIRDTHWVVTSIIKHLYTKCIIVEYDDRLRRVKDFICESDVMFVTSIIPFHELKLLLINKLRIYINIFLIFNTVYFHR